MLPTSLIALAITIVAVLPGSMYTWAFERQVSAYGATLVDRVLRFIALSVIFHLALGWPEYWLFRSAFAGETFNGGQFAIAWTAVLVLVAVPAAAGTIIGGLYATRSDREDWGWVRRHLTAPQEDKALGFILGRTPAPRAWDNLFSERLNLYFRVETVDGTAVAGLFADKSYAGGYPNDGDLYLEQSWSLNDDGSLGEPLGYPVYLPAAQSHASRHSTPGSRSNREHHREQGPAAVRDREEGRLLRQQARLQRATAAQDAQRDHPPCPQHEAEAVASRAPRD